MKQGTYVNGEKTGKGREVEMKTLPVHRVGREERCEQEKERGRLGKWRENRGEKKGKKRQETGEKGGTHPEGGEAVNSEIREQ